MNGFACGMAGPLLGMALVLSSAGGLQAAELQVLAGGGIAGPMRDLAAQFERASGHKLVIRFGTTPELIRLATAGGPFDLAVVPREVFRDDAARARCAPGPTVDVARVGLGVAEAVKAKMKAQKGPAQMVEAVAKGEAELGIFLINVLTAPGLDVVGPFPAELQAEIVFAAAVAADSKETEAAKAFIAFLTTPGAAATIKAMGMQP